MTERPAKARGIETPKRVRRPRRRDAAGGSQTRLLAIVSGSLALATLLLYLQTVHYDFVMYDDDTFVYNNPVLQGGLKASALLWAFGLHFANWHPLTWFSYLLDAQLFGMHAVGFHMVNLLLHTASVVLLFLALSRMTGRLWRSAVVAAVFAFHPLHVESVAWVAERKDVLSTFLEMIALLLYARYAERPSMRRYLWVAAIFACSVMAKPMSVTFPLVLLLLDYWPLGRVHWPPRWPADRRAVAEKVPLLAISLVSSVLTVVAQRDYGAVASLEGIPLLTRLANSATAYVVYIREALWPANLAVLYPTTAPVWNNAILSLGILLLVTAGVLVLAHVQPYLLTGWFWYLGMLVPVIGLVQVGAQARADRYMYLPLVGLSIAVVWMVADWLERHPAMRRPVAAATVAVVLAFAMAAWRQIGYWKNSRTLFEHAVEITNRNSIMRNNLGVILSRAGDDRGAEAQYLQAIVIDPGYAEAQGNLGNLLLRQGKLQAARPRLEEAVRLKPDFAMAQLDIGIVYANAARYPDAIEHLNRAMVLTPQDPEVHSNLCYALEHAGRLEEAVARCREALRLRPDYPDAQFNLKNSLAELHSAPQTAGR